MDIPSRIQNILQRDGHSQQLELIRYLGKKISSVFWQGIPPREREIEREKRREEKNIKAIGKK
jgi:hypothetical protein